MQFESEIMYNFCPKNDGEKWSRFFLNPFVREV